LFLFFFLFSSSALANCDASLARTEKNHRAELEQSKRKEKELQSQLEEAKTASQHLQKSFAGVVKEKERITAELVEVKAISEELMTILEANGLA